MSDFDREAEREKLREQFADDEDDRASTERMSELLLQGATMTNRHCDQCGDPIFRHDGAEFCPTCRQPAADATDVETAEGGGQPAPRSDLTPAERPGESAGHEPGGEPASGDRPPETADESGDDSPPHPSTDPLPDGVADAAGTKPVTTGDETGLAAARAALERTTTRLAGRAEASDDLGRTREYLAAAREAAEALDAVNRAAR